MSAPLDSTPPPAPPTPPRRGLVARVLTLTPPWWGRAAVHIAAALLVAGAGLISWSGGFEPMRRVHASFRPVARPGAAWVLAEPAADDELVAVEISVTTRRGPGWVVHRAYVRGVDGAATTVPSQAELGRMLTSWADAIDAERRPVPAGPPEAALGRRRIPVPQGVRPDEFAELLRGLPGGPVPVSRGRGAAAACGWIAVGGTGWMIAALLVGTERARRRRARAAAPAILDAGVCPACRYARAGLAPAAPCPECGADPAAIRAQARAARGLTPEAP